jgi:hypothetical protein
MSGIMGFGAYCGVVERHADEGSSCITSSSTEVSVYIATLHRSARPIVPKEFRAPP